MKKRENIISNKIINACQLPKDVLLGASIISMTGNTDLLVENFKCIIKYQPDMIILQCKKNQLQIFGKNLYIEYYTNEEIKVNGCICELKFL